MRSGLYTGAAALAMLLGSVTAHAQKGGSGGPVFDPGDPGDPGADPSDPGAGGTGTGTGTGGAGGTTSAPTPMAYTYGSGALVFSLDNLPTGPSGTQAFYQPAQDYTSLGLGTLPSNQGGLTQTVGGTTLSLSTATYVEGSGAPQTVIRVENDSSNFGNPPPACCLVPAGVQVGFEASVFSGGQPGAVFVNFSNALSYFSINLYRLYSGPDAANPLSVMSTVTAYSGLNGTGSVLGSTSGSVTGGSNFGFATIELANLSGARSFTLQGANGLPNYDAITATLAPAVAGVPEPASWAMFVGGFGLAGYALRRRRAAAALA